MNEGKPPDDRELDPTAAPGIAVRQLRERAGLTQRKLAHLAELEEQDLIALEDGRLEPTWGALRRLASALGVPLPELMSLIEILEGS
jgi:transcriptional regulator with XRE-family HTH domain